MITIGTVDFTGKVEVTTNEFTVGNLDNYIVRYQEELTIELLGVDLYGYYVANSTDPEFVLIEDSLVFQTSCGTIYNSLGMKDMLLCFIFFMYTRDLYSRQSVAGTVKASNENSTIPSNVSALLWQRYNEGVKSYEAIQQYILENKEDYPLFKGVKKGVIIPYF